MMLFTATIASATASISSPNLASGSDGSIKLTSGDGSSLTISGPPQAPQCDSSSVAKQLPHDRYGRIEYIGFDCSDTGCLTTAPVNTQTVTAVGTGLIAGVPGMYRCTFKYRDEGSGVNGTFMPLSTPTFATVTKLEVGRESPPGTTLRVDAADRKAVCSVPQIPYVYGNPGRFEVIVELTVQGIAVASVQPPFPEPFRYGLYAATTEPDVVLKRSGTGYPTRNIDLIVCGADGCGADGVAFNVTSTNALVSVAYSFAVKTVVPGAGATVTMSISPTVSSSAPVDGNDIVTTVWVTLTGPGGSASIKVILTLEVASLSCFGLPNGEYSLIFTDSSGDTIIKQSYCHNDVNVGGDGSSREKAGKTCGTIRKVYHSKTNGPAWIFMDDIHNPVQIYCDQNSCGNDVASSFQWGDSTEDYVRCGGWTLAVKALGTEAGTYDSYPHNSLTSANFMNRLNTDQWRDAKEIGDTNNVDAINALGPAYSHHKASDFMIRALNTRSWGPSIQHSSRPYYSIGMRIPETLTSMHAQVYSCKRREDAQLLCPHCSNGVASVSNHELSFNAMEGGVDWESQSTTDHNAGANTRWGFFLIDNNCGGTTKIAGCSLASGHSGNVLGMGTCRAQ